MPVKQNCLALGIIPLTEPCFSDLAPADIVGRAYNRKCMDNGVAVVNGVLDIVEVQPNSCNQDILVCPRCRERVVKFIQVRVVRADGLYNYWYMPITG
jgi:hypothetical protein